MDSLNSLAMTLCREVEREPERFNSETHRVAGATVIDFGVACSGGLQAGIQLAQICLANLASVSVAPATGKQALPLSVHVSSDAPLHACLGSQYAGWPVQTEDYFAMGSGPFRLLRGKEEMLLHLQLSESELPSDSRAVGVLESDKLPDQAVVEYVAAECKVTPDQLVLCIAPVTSIAGTVQVLARSVETAMHKLHAVGLDPRLVKSGWGVAPMPPIAQSTIEGIGRTNDVILYGGEVVLWVDMDQDVIDTLGPQVPSTASSDHGRPFAEIFKSYDYDFYKVDPGLFSPAVITFSNLRTGIARSFGKVAPEVLQQSFGNESSA